MQVRGPFSTSQLSGTEMWKEATGAIIRVVDEDDVWKLEHIRVY